MTKRRIDIPSIRREQIIDAATAIIAEKGLQKLSLSAIEHKAGMSRGQLTYYFPAKEDILLAVFDRLLEMMCRRAGSDDRAWFESLDWWAKLQHVLMRVLEQRPAHPEFHSLQYTFLAQIGHREDFRQRLARLYEDWRSHMTRDLAQELERRHPGRKIKTRAVATLVQALLHGLTMQLAADPEAFDRQEMKELCLEMLGMYLGRQPQATNGSHDARSRNGHATHKRSRRLRTAPRG